MVGSVSHTYNGYFHALPRLGAALALLVPLENAPLIMNLIGMTAQVLPVCILLSRRLRSFGSLRYRVLLSAVYLGLPNCHETNVTITCVQWHLAPAGCLLLLGTAPISRAAKYWDVAFYLLCGLTGPFSLLLLPIATAWALIRRFEPWRWIPVTVFASTAIVQLYALLLIEPRTIQPSLGASAMGLARIVAGQIYLGTLIGSNGYALSGRSAWLILVALAGSALIGYCCYRATREMTVFLVFSAMVLGVSLFNPIIAQNASSGTAWHILYGARGIRYWLVPMIGFAWVIVWYAFGPKPTIVKRLIGCSLLVLMLVGLIREWRHPALQDLHFAAYPERFAASPKGTVLTTPENPPGWKLRLLRH